MSDLRRTLAAINELPLARAVRVLSLCGDHDRVIALSGMRKLLPAAIELVPGPGCAATICPEADLYQALCLARQHAVTLLAGENMMRLPLGDLGGDVGTLAEAARAGADIRPVSTPIEAVVAAQATPQRQMVYFVAGFETLLAPLAGMIIDGLPDNLSVLICGRRVEPLVEQLLLGDDSAIDALLLPGNRCAVTGTDDWDQLSGTHHKPAAVAGYTPTNILSALHAVLVQHNAGTAHIDNFYQQLAKPGGNPMARDRMERVFELNAGDWRGVGEVGRTGYRLRRTYDNVNADRRFPDYRVHLTAQRNRMPAGCECGAVLLARKLPSQCPHYQRSCTPQTPVGPCMASEEGACFLYRDNRDAA